MVHIYPLPDTQRLSEVFRVSAGGERVPVSECFVSAVPYNRRWPGHQRSADQREAAYFVRLAADEPVSFEVRRSSPFESAVVRPLSKRITPDADGDAVRFTLREPGGYTLELDGYHNALHIFLDPPADCEISPEDGSVIYFGTGEHHAGTIEMTSGQTLFIDEGAVLYATVRAENAEDIRILGRGILDNSENVEEILFEVESLGDGMTDVCNSRRANTIHTINCRRVLIDGITIRDSLVYNVAAHGCDDMVVRNVKTIGCWRYNSDGIDLHNCTSCLVTGCFVRTFDDSVCIKGHDGYQDICDNITVENCVVWCDWDHALEIGAETRAAEMKNIIFRNCDVIHTTDVALSIFNIDYGHVHDVLYEDIRVEYDSPAAKSAIQPDDETPYPEFDDPDYISTLIGIAVSRHHEYSSATDGRRGRNSRITFRDIGVYSTRMPPSRVVGYSPENMSEDITFDGIYLNGRRLTSLEEMRADIQRYTKNILFI